MHSILGPPRRALPALPRSQGLDVLRGIAILLVICNHLEPRTIPGFVAPSGTAGFFYWHLKSFGNTGVDLFFVLSGFLISGLLFKELTRSQRIDFPRFWLRRAFKIFPSYLLLLLILWICSITSWSHRPWTHLLFVQNYLDNYTNGPTWSLAVEEHFYLLLPLVLLVLGGATFSRPILFRALLVAFILFITAGRCLHQAGVVSNNDFMLSHFRMDSLAMGVLARHLLHTHSWPARAIQARPWTATMCATGLLFPALVVSRIHPFMFCGGYGLLALGYGILVILAAQRDPIADRATVAVAMVGRWSYNIYLWDSFLLVLPIPGYAFCQYALVASLEPGLLRYTLQFLWFVLAALAIGGLLTRWFEQPFLHLRDRVLPWTSRDRDP
ncbi:MAG: acyltransferase [Verrucomicrobiota bacterium]